MKEIQKMVCGNNYKVCYKNEKHGEETWVYGEVVNYSNSGVYILCKDKFLQIPHKAIVWMLPNGLTNQKKEEIKEKALEEAAEKIKDTVESIYAITGQKPNIVATKEIIKALSEKSETTIY